MSNDAGDDTQSAESVASSLSTLGLIGALARAMEDHQKDVIKPKKDAPRDALVDIFTKTKQSGLVVEVDGEEVGRYTVNTTKDKFEVDDRAAFDAHAEAHGEIDVVITAKPSFENACLTYARRDPETGDIFDSRTGEVIPGLKFVPGGKPTGTVTWTWKTHRRQPIGKEVLLGAYQRGRLDEFLRETPELLPTRQPSARDE